MRLPLPLNGCNRYQSAGNTASTSAGASGVTENCFPLTWIRPGAPGLTRFVPFHDHLGGRARNLDRVAVLVVCELKLDLAHHRPIVSTASRIQSFLPESDFRRDSAGLRERSAAHPRSPPGAPDHASSWHPLPSNACPGTLAVEIPGRVSRRGSERDYSGVSTGVSLQVIQTVRPAETLRRNPLTRFSRAHVHTRARARAATTPVDKTQCHRGRDPRNRVAPRSR